MPCLCRRWNHSSRPGARHGWALGVAEGCRSFGTEGLGSESVPRVCHYWVTTVSVWAVVSARQARIRTGPGAAQCQGGGSQMCVHVRFCVCIFRWENAVDRAGGFCIFAELISVFLPCCFTEANSPCSPHTNTRVQDLCGSYLDVFLHMHAYVYIHSLVCVYLCIFMCAHQHKCTRLCVYVCFSVPGESLEYLSTD